MTGKQMTMHVLGALDRLSAQDRALVAMRYSEGFTDSEIAESTSMPVGRSIVQRLDTEGHLARAQFDAIDEEGLPAIRPAVFL